MKTTSCGLTLGDVIESWTIISFPRKENGIWCFDVRCKCGFERTHVAKKLASRSSKQCISCANKAKETHGESYTNLYTVWKGMQARCYNPKNEAYLNYGGRGITIWQEWLDDPSKFFVWARANGYREGLEIDREQNHLGYSPDNCRWVTSQVNNNNRRVRRTKEQIMQDKEKVYA